jgi:HEAT repeat protein
MQINGKQEETIEGLISNFESNNIESQYSAHVLVNKFGLLAIPALNNALTNQNTYIKYWAAISLALLGNNHVIDYLIEALLTKQTLLCREAARAVGKLKEKRGIGALTLLLDHPRKTVRRTAVEVLDRIQDEQAMEGFKKALMDTDYAVKLAAIRGLSNLKSREAISILTEMLELCNLEDTHEENSLIIEAITKSLKNITDNTKKYEI